MRSQIPIVIQLQELSSDSSNNLSDLLRKALLIATKLGLKDFEQWALNELNGYKNIDELPEYRKIIGDLQVYNPYQGYISFIISDSRVALIVRKISLTDSIESLQHIVNKSKKAGGSVMYSFTPEQEKILMKIQGTYKLRPTLAIGMNYIAAILEQVRTHLLNWSLNLEREGILGEGLTFSKEERRKAEMSSEINITHFQGILGDVSSSTVSQTMNMTITAGSFESLASYLKDQGISSQDIDILKDAIKEDPVPSVKGHFGIKVSSWIGKMVEMAASGVWKIGIAAAGNLLSTAIGKYYSL